MGNARAVITLSLLVLVGATACTSGEKVNGPSSAPTVSAPSASPSPSERPPSACKGHSARTADLDGDSEPDWVYLDWTKRGGSGQTRFGWCVSGRHSSIKTAGQAEVLYVHDLYGDGRHEVFFGGNTCCGMATYVATYERGKVRLVTLPNGKKLSLMNGYWPSGERERWTVYGCEGIKGVAVTQVVATVQGDHLLVRKTRYAIDGADARSVGRDRYTIPDSGKNLRGRDVSEAVGACIEIFEDP